MLICTMEKSGLGTIAQIQTRGLVWGFFGVRPPHPPDYSGKAKHDKDSFNFRERSGWWRRGIFVTFGFGVDFMTENILSSSNNDF